MKLSKPQRLALAEHRQQIRSDRKSLDVQFDQLLLGIGRLLDPINRAVNTHNSHRQAAQAFVTAIAEALRDTFDEKSERWQASDAGQQASAMIEEWESVALDNIDPITILLPDRPSFTKDDALNLPEDDE